MHKNHFILVAIIIAVGLALFFFGRTTSLQAPPDAITRTHEALKQGKVVVLVFTEGRWGKGREYLNRVRQAVKEWKRDEVVVIQMDIKSPSEEKVVQILQIKAEDTPSLWVVGTDGYVYYEGGETLDPERLKGAVHDALTKKPTGTPMGLPSEEGK